MNPFLLSNEIIGPLTLRPWTLTTQMAIMALADCKFSEIEQMAAMAWMQSQEPEDVEKAVNDKSAEKKIKAFTRNFPMSLVKPVAEWCDRQNKLITAGQIEIVPKGGADPAQPGN